MPVEGTPATVQSGQTPILIWWDYLLASEVQPVDKNFKIVIPSDGVYAGYYDQAISATAPRPGRRPAVGGVPVLDRRPEPLPRGLDPPDRDGRDDHGGHDRQVRRRQRCRPCRAASTLTLPTIAQQTTAGNVVAQQWPSVSG